MKKITYIAAIIIVFALIWYLFDNDKAIDNIGKDSSIIGNNINKNTALNIDKTIEKPINIDKTIEKPINPPTIKIKKSTDNYNKAKKIVNNKLAMTNSSEEESRDVPMPESVFKNAMQELESDDFQKNMLINMGFSKEGSEKIVANNPKNPLSIKDMPKEIQKLIYKDLKNRKEKGYSDTTNKNADEIIDVMSHIVSTSKSVSNLRFSLSKIPTIVNTDYNYMGYTFSGVFDTKSVKGTYGSVRRVYNKLDSSHILIIEESAINKNASSYLLKELVNTSVNEYPAIYTIKKSPDNEMYAMLNWKTPAYSYQLYFVGTLNDNTENTLVSIGNEISKINIENEESSETNLNLNNPLLNNPLL